MPFGYASLLTIGLIYMDVVLKPCRGLDADGFACRNDAALPALFRAAVVGGQHHAVFVGHEAEIQVLKRNFRGVLLKMAGSQPVSQ